MAAVAVAVASLSPLSSSDWMAMAPYLSIWGASSTSAYPSSSHSHSAPASKSSSYAHPQKPRLRLPMLPELVVTPSTQNNTTAASRAGTTRSLPIPIPPTPTVAPPTPTPVVAEPAAAAPVSLSPPRPTGRKRSPSFTAGSGVTLAASTQQQQSLSLSLANAPSPPPSLARPSLPRPAPAPPSLLTQTQTQQRVPPFLQRTYPTPDSRKRLVARSLLRIHAVGKPRAPCAVFPCTKKPEDGYEDECGRRGYVPSRLGGECVVA